MQGQGRLCSTRAWLQALGETLHLFAVNCTEENCGACQVGIQAYLLWEKAGKPDGADFAGDARKTLEAQLASGMSVEQLEKALKAPSPQVALTMLSLCCPTSTSSLHMSACIWLTFS